MAIIKYTFAKASGPDDWGPLPRQFAKGDTIFRFSGYDYGCARDDMMYGNRETITCSERDGESPFFTVPVEMLLDKDGNRPMGDYVRIRG